MKSTIIAIILLLIASTCPAQEESRPYLRHPALSPDGSTICFSCKGDLWLVPATGGQARRLTVNPADDLHPQFSPDGSKIVFASDRYKNSDLYVIPVSGGEPTRLTYYTGSDTPTGWTPDGDTVIFYSYRDFYYDIYKVALSGGTPVALTGGFRDAEYYGKITPDGSKMVFNNGSGRSRWWRAQLAGNENTDIWMIDRTLGNGRLERITSRDGHEIWPIYDTENETIYFVANRDSLPNIWKIDLSNNQESRVTSFTDDGVQWLNSDPQMSRMVFAQDFYIWYFDPNEGDPRRVNIVLESDNLRNPVKQMVYHGNDIQEYDISPDNKLAALIIRGEVFLIPTEEPELARRITNTDQREKHLCFGSDSRTLYYASDRNGNYDIYMYDLVNRREKRLTDDSANETKPLCSPDTSKLVFYRGLDKIVLYDLKKEAEVSTLEGLFIDLAVEPYLEYDFSPDSRYLTFTMAGETYETNIYITDFKSAPVNVSRLTDYCYRPRFSDNGKLLYFSRWTRDDHVGTYKIELAYEPFEFAEDKLDSLLTDQDAEDEKDKDKKDQDKKIEPVKIDFADIHKRLEPLLNLEASQNVPVVTSDGKKVLFVASIMGKPEVWSVNLEDDPELTQLTHSGKGKDYLRLSDESKFAFFLEGGRLQKIDLGSNKAEGLSFTAEMDINIDRERAAGLGVSVTDIGSTLETFLGGRVVTNFKRSTKQYDVILQVNPKDRSTPDAIKEIYIRGNGGLVQLANLISVEKTVAPKELNHYNRIRSATITASLQPGISLDKALDDFDRIKNEKLSASINSELAGQSLEYKSSSTSLYFMFLLALVFIYLVLSAQFESFIDPLTLLLSVPLAVFGALFTLFIFDQSLNIYSQIGLIMLVGLVTKNAILIVEFANQLRGRGLEVTKAIVQASTVRLRPILMTSLSTIFGVLPIAIGFD